MLVMATSWKEKTSTKNENKDTTVELEFDFENSDESDVCEAHGLQQHNVQHLEISSGVPMTDSRSQNQFNELVYTWIDDLWKKSTFLSSWWCSIFEFIRWNKLDFLIWIFFPVLHNLRYFFIFKWKFHISRLHYVQLDFFREHLTAEISHWNS